MKKKHLKVIISSPSDVITERNTMEKIIEKINLHIASPLGLYLEIMKWEKNAYPDFHSDGTQGIIDPILDFSNCEIFIGILWHRFGTITKDGTTGTEHEFNLAYQEWKNRKKPHVMFYFNQKEYSPTSSEDAKQWTNVLKFKESLPKEGFYWNYNGKKDFEQKVFDHLANLLRFNYEQKNTSHAFENVDKKTNATKDNVINFLDSVGLKNDERYQAIDHLWVPPNQFEEIKNTLNSNKIVFIIGTQEFGKTYTAIRLLFEYYLKGYEVKILNTGDTLDERKKGRNEIIKIANQIKDKTIVYIEDPFGKTKYEGEQIPIKNLIKTIRTKNAFVIITSREEMFREFNSKYIAEKVNDELITQINGFTPSYDARKRKEILLKWANYKECSWVQDRQLTKEIIQYIENGKYLPTILNIKDFIISTIDENNKDVLFESIIENSKDTSQRFADNIMQMSEDMILFLSFPFISNNFSPSFVQSQYDILKKELEIKNPRMFENVCKILSDKVVITNKVQFSHPSYSESIYYLIDEKNTFDEESKMPKKIFFESLLRLLHVPDYGKEVAQMAMKIFNKIPIDIQKAVFSTFILNPNTSNEAAQIILENFHNLPLESREKIMLEIITNGSEIDYILRAVALNFDKMSDMRIHILEKILEKKYYNEYLASILINNYKKLSEKLKKKIFELINDDKAIEYIPYGICYHYNELPNNVQEILIKLSENHHWEIVESAISMHFDTISEKNRNEILLKLIRNKKSNSNLIKNLFKKFKDKIPDDIKNEFYSS